MYSTTLHLDETSEHTWGYPVTWGEGARVKLVYHAPIRQNTTVRCICRCDLRRAVQAFTLVFVGVRR
jgi:hypothetical protein